MQFIIVAAIGWYENFSATARPPLFLRKRRIPIWRWLPFVLLYAGVSVANNFALGFNVSVPVHIILRSGGSVTTMAFGWLWGKKFSRLQVVSVMLLTLGVIGAAMADAHAQVGFSLCSYTLFSDTSLELGWLLTIPFRVPQGKTSRGDSSNQPISTYVIGVGIIFLALVLAAIMGLYNEGTYQIYGNHWRENLFYSHVLSLPLFLPFSQSLHRQFRVLNSSSPIFSTPSSTLQKILQTRSPLPSNYTKLESQLSAALPPPAFEFVRRHFNPPNLMLALVANALTQYACIRGVNKLAARTSALTVTIVLNIRKLVSLLLSIWLFGNRLPAGVLLGAAVVFASGALYGWEEQRQKRARIMAEQVATGTEKTTLETGIEVDKRGS